MAVDENARLPDPLPLADLDEVEVGETVLAIGSPTKLLLKKGLSNG